ncbi:MAG: DUF2007 domain-containing protein [Anaerolineales bacterium]|jgi:hypothetical protein|nr:DUF2007 domain-containing protein [Anaerolineales bacterium]
MNDENWQVIDEVDGGLQAEILRGLLEAQGIQVLLSQEGISHFAFSVTVGPLSTVQILVPTSQVETATAILEDYRQGKFEAAGEEFPDIGESSEDHG